jgi:hypothetical protein
MSIHIEAFVSFSKFERIFFVEFCFLVEQDRQIWARLAYSSTKNILKLIKGLVCNRGWEENNYRSLCCNFYSTPTTISFVCLKNIHYHVMVVVSVNYGIINGLRPISVTLTKRRIIRNCFSCPPTIHHPSLHTWLAVGSAWPSFLWWKLQPINLITT